MHRFILHIGILLTVFLLTSCRPSGVLSTQEMTDVLFDIQLVESLSEMIDEASPADWTQGLSKADFTDLAYQSVLNKHNVTEEDFYLSVAYYSKKMRLYTRIYSDLAKKLDAYAQSIDTWTENRKTELEVESMMKKGDARIRALFEYMHIKPDTTSRTSFSYRPDSVMSINRRYIYRLMKKNIVAPPVYSMIGLKNLPTIQGNTLADSTGRMVVDSTTNADIPSVDVLLKKALPMDELLRLQAAGAYDALKPKVTQSASQPTSRPERAKKLKERASNQR